MTVRNPGLPDIQPFHYDLHQLAITDGILFGSLATIVGCAIGISVIRQRRKEDPKPLRVRTVIRSLLFVSSIASLTAIGLQFGPWYFHTTDTKTAWQHDVKTWLADEYGITVSQKQLDAATSSKQFTATVAGHDETVLVGATPDKNLILVDAAKHPVAPVQH